MRYRLITAVVLLLAGSALAADPGTPGGLPPGAENAKQVLQKSPRHGEWVDIKVPGKKDPLRAYVVYPERADKAPVVLVIHEIFGLSDWVRGVADQLAADGFIAIAPDMLSGHGPNGGGSAAIGSEDNVRRVIGEVKRPEVMADLDAAREYALKFPSASGKSACIGFCWGGGQSFAYATHQPDLNAAAVYYGTPPSQEDMAKISAPVAGFYGGNDNRVTSTVQPTEQEMKKLNKSYSPHVYKGAGHGFLRQQSQPANMKAAEEAWPATIEFLKEHTK